MEARGNTLTCTHCGNTAIMDEYGLMHPKGEADVVFEDTVAWCAFQKRVLEEDLQAGRFRLEDAALLYQAGRGQASLWSRWGEGRVVLDESGLRYDGTQEGREVSKLFSAQATFALPCTPGRQFRDSQPHGAPVHPLCGQPQNSQIRDRHARRP